MTEMLRTQNPGLRRRFSPEQAFIFEDYSPGQLLEIFHQKCRDLNVQPTPEAAKKALDKLDKQKSMANFGNAGAVDTLVRGAVAKATLRGIVGGMIRLEESDFTEEEEMKDKGMNPLDMLDSLIKMDAIREKLEELKRALAVRKEEGDCDSALGHFVFRGSPGTGLFLTFFGVYFEQIIDKKLQEKQLLHEPWQKFCID